MNYETFAVTRMKTPYSSVYNEILTFIDHGLPKMRNKYQTTAQYGNGNAIRIVQYKTPIWDRVVVSIFLSMYNHSLTTKIDIIK